MDGLLALALVAVFILALIVANDLSDKRLHQVRRQTATQLGLIYSASYFAGTYRGRALTCTFVKRDEDSDETQIALIMNPRTASYMRLSDKGVGPHLHTQLDNDLGGRFVAESRPPTLVTAILGSLGREGRQALFLSPYRLDIRISGQELYCMVDGTIKAERLQSYFELISHMADAVENFI